MEGEDRRVVARAPIRVCDIGGWTDTWFAGHGAVFNIAVSPHARVEITAREARPATVRFDVTDFGESYEFAVGAAPGRHRLLESAVELVGAPEDAALDVSIKCGAPAGASTGTSAAVVVALVSALVALWDKAVVPDEIARIAHRVETEMLGLQSGVQDQLASAHGGVNFIEIDEYPNARVQHLPLNAPLVAALDARLLLVFLGRGHVSSHVHEKVIAELAVEGPGSPRLEELRSLARRARDAFLDSDLDGLGGIMRENTDAQARLHPDLVGADAARVIEAARRLGAVGWKVNGAGGEGGSVTLLAGAQPDARAELAAAIDALDPAYRVIEIALDTGGAVGLTH